MNNAVAPRAPDSRTLGNTERRQRVVDSIKRRIVIGDLKPGARIVEAQLTASLQVSRPTAREALNQLARDGFLVQEAYRGHRVADLVENSIMEIAYTRVALDKEAIAAIVSDGSGRRMEQLEKVWQEFEQVGSSDDPLVMHEAHMAFHRGIWEASGNYLLMRIWPVIEAQMTIALAYDQFTRRDSVRAYAIHAALMQAIRSQDSARISEALKVHTIDSARGLTFMLSHSAS